MVSFTALCLDTKSEIVTLGKYTTQQNTAFAFDYDTWQRDGEIFPASHFFNFFIGYMHYSKLWYLIFSKIR